MADVIFRCLLGLLLLGSRQLGIFLDWFLLDFVAAKVTGGTLVLNLFIKFITLDLFIKFSGVRCSFTHTFFFFWGHLKWFILPGFKGSLLSNLRTNYKVSADYKKTKAKLAQKTDLPTKRFSRKKRTPETTNGKKTTEEKKNAKEIAAHTAAAKKKQLKEAAIKAKEEVIKKIKVTKEEATKKFKALKDAVKKKRFKNNDAEKKSSRKRLSRRYAPLRKRLQLSRRDVLRKRGLPRKDGSKRRLPTKPRRRQSNK